MSVRSSFTLSLILALAVAGCSKDEAAQPQPGAQAGTTAAPDQAGDFTGKIDRGKAGTLMPAIALKDPAGKALNTGALAGNPVLLNAWATWCAPCVKEMPTLDAIAGAYGSRLRVITVSQDLQGAAEVGPFFAKHRFAHLQPWLDPDNALSTALGGEGVLPTTVLYSASGEEIARVIGGFDWESPEARALIDEAVGS